MRKILLATAAACAVLAPASLNAQSAVPTSNDDSLQVEDIVVTARRTEESLIDVPIAITAFSAAKIQAADLKDFKDVARFTPGLFFTDLGSARPDRAIRNYIIRGLNLQNLVGVADPALLFVDGAPVVSGELGGFTDIERIEILRGPQSVYFGRNTFAGAINVVTRTPGYDWRARLEAEYARFDTKVVSGSVEGPIIADKVAFRIAGKRDDRGGQYRNSVDGKRLGNRKTDVVSLTLAGEPIDGLTFKAYGAYTKFDDGAAPSVRIYRDFFNCNAGLAPPGGTTATPNYICGVAPIFPRNRIAANTEAVTDRFLRQVYAFSIFDDPFIDKAGLQKRNTDASFALDYTFESGIKMSALTSYHRTKTQTISDEDTRDTRNTVGNPSNPNAAPTLNAQFLVERQQRNFSQEARIASAQDKSFRWVAGGNYISLRTINSNVSGEIATAGSALPTNGVPFFVSSTGFSRAKTYGIFGGAYFDFTDQLTLGAEARYQWDKVSNQPLLARAQPAPAPTPSDTFKSFSPRVTLDYKPIEDITIFGLFARGYRPGAFNARLLPGAGLDPRVIAEVIRQTGAGVNVEPERLDDFELGVKGRVFDGRATFSLTAYTSKLKNQQISNIADVNLVGTGIPRTMITAIVNVGATRLRGIEFEGAVRVSRELDISAAYAINDTNIRQFICAVCAQSVTGVANVRGNRLPGAPKYSGNVIATYRMPINDTYKWFVRGEYLYQGNKFELETNLTKSGRQDLVNLRAGIESDKLRIEGYITNLFNDRSYDAIARATDALAAGFNSFAVALPARPVYGIRTSYNF